MKRQLYGQPVQVVGCQKDWNCGLAVVQHDNPALPKPLFCMFLISDLTSEDIQPHDIVGIDVVIDAVLLDAGASVPYLAKRVLYPKYYRQVPEQLVDSIEPNQVAIDAHDLFSNRLYNLVMKNDSSDERQSHTSPFRNFSISTNKRRSFTSRSRSKSPHPGRKSRSPFYNHERRSKSPHLKRSRSNSRHGQSRGNTFHMLRHSFDNLASSSQEDLEHGLRERCPSDDRRNRSFERLHGSSDHRHASRNSTHRSRYDEHVRDHRRRDSYNDKRDASRHSQTFDGRERYSLSRSASRSDRDQAMFDFEDLQRRDGNHYDNPNNLSFEYNENHRGGYDGVYHFDQEREGMSPRSPQRWGSYDYQQGHSNYGYGRSRSRSGSFDFNERRYFRSPFDSRDHSLRRSRSHSYFDMSPQRSGSYLHQDSRSNSFTRRSRSRSVYDSRPGSLENFDQRRYPIDNRGEFKNRSRSSTERNSQPNYNPVRHSVKRSRSQSADEKNGQLEKCHKVHQSISIKKESPSDRHDKKDVIVIPNEVVSGDSDIKPIVSTSNEGLSKENIILRIDNVKDESKSNNTSSKSESSKFRNKEQPKERSHSPLRDPGYHKEIRRSKLANDAKLSVAKGIRTPYEREVRPESRDLKARSHDRRDRSRDRRRERSRDRRRERSHERRNITMAADKELEDLNKEIKELQVR